MFAKKTCDVENDEEIVISGISGRFPESDNINELKENLYNNVDMITEDDRRWPLGFYGLPTRNGKLKDLSKFDAQFFGVHGKQTNNMDPQARMLLELTYEAIVDAGINPQILRGTNTGVYVGACVSEVEEAFVQDVSKVSGYALTGCSRSMFANRVSYTFDFQGPSYTMDTACSSSFLALQQAVLGLRTNKCDQAIVGGVNICVKPATSIQFHKLNMLSMDGKCKHLDSECSGYVRSETCSVIFLQKKRNAKRIYGTILHAKTNTDGYKEEGITFPSWVSQMNLMKETVLEAKINPLDVNYIEAHGTGTPAGDPIETKAIAQVYCVGRKDPLLIGSIKTNLGHAEPASGMNSIAKVLLTFQNKLIPANLHFSKPNPKIPELINGSVKPVIENTPYNDGIIAVNSFGFGGVNVHLLLKPNIKEMSESDKNIIEKIPRIILATGRTEEAVKYIFDYIEKNPQDINREFLSLLNDISMTFENSGMGYRGFMIADKHPDLNTSFSKEISRASEKRPVWFVYSGMGSQWTSMAKGLMSLEIFRQSIDKSAKILERFQIDLLNLLLNDDENILDTTVAPFVTIASIQIALTDVLKKLGIEPDGIVGHSVGELGCAYGDGVFTAEQMLLAAYWRGKCVEEANLPKGLMAAVGLTWEEAKARCPNKVVPACHNSQDSVTISGSYDETQKFLEELRAENVFAREVKSCGVAFHSYFMEAIASTLLEKLEKVIPERALRTSRWISSSFPENQWNEDAAKYSAPEYYVHNLTSPVLFCEALQFVPKNAIVIEIAPHSLLQPIIKRALGSDIFYTGLMKRNNNEENMNMLLNSIGKLYNFGLNPDISVLYPKVSYPVSRNVQSLSSLIKWDHSQNWLVTLYPEYFNPNNMSDYTVKIDLQEKKDEFYAGHCIDGRNLFPATGYLFLAWQMLSKIKGQFYEKTPVEFENVTLHRATILSRENPVKFKISLMEVSGEFTINEGATVVVTGRIFVPENKSLKLQNFLTDESLKSNDQIKLTSKDIYKELRLRGYDYDSSFQGIVESSFDFKSGKLKFSNWVVLADTMLQIGILGKSTRGLYLPVRFQSVRCDPEVLFQALKKSGKDSVLDVVTDHRLNAIVAPGIEIQGVKINLTSRRLNTQIPILEKYLFTPYFGEVVINKNHQSKLSEYISVTSVLAKQVVELLNLDDVKNLFKSEKVAENNLKNYLESKNQDYQVLIAFKEILSNSKNLPQILNTFQKDLSNDLFSKACESQYHIRVPIEIVVENMTGSKLSIIEMNPTSRVYVQKIKNLIELTGYSINVKYTLLSETSEKIEGVEKIHWTTNFPTKSVLQNNDSDLVIYKDSFGFKLTNEEVDYKLLVKSIYDITKNRGFCLIIFRSKPTFAETVLYNLLKLQLPHSRIDQFKLEASKLDFELVSERNDSYENTVLLFRKLEHKPVADNQIIINISDKNYKTWVPILKSKLAEHHNEKNIWLVANDHPTTGLVGLIKCLRQEPHGECVRGFLFSDSKKNELQTFSFNNGFYAELLKKDLVLNIYRDGKLGTFKHYELDEENEIETEHAFINVATRGDLSTLGWYEAQHKYWPHLSGNLQNSLGKLCTVYYAPLNFRDIMLATGKLPPDALPGDLALQNCILGLEFSGRNQSGNRVMGMVPAKGLATSVLIDDDQFLWNIPDNWSMEEASTVPVAYATAYYSLVVRGDLEEEESVLIHSGSGGVGQAAISICLSMGCTVFTTVGSDEKKCYLKSIFPKLTDKNFANSRDTSFEQHILRETNGRGVDVVLNSLSDDKLQASVRCLAQHGRFLEIGKYDLSQNNPLGLAVFLKNVTFHGILLDALFGSTNTSKMFDFHRKEVARLLAKGIETGAVQPLKRTIFEMDNIESAFRFMATGKHIGKVILKIREEEKQKIQVSPKKMIKAVSRTVLHPFKSYIITGGLGGFGLELARWLVERGARNLVLTSRTGPKEPYQYYILEKLEKAGVRLLISVADIAVLNGAEKLIKEASSFGPVGGIFNLAMVLSDGFFENQTPDSFEKVCSIKVSGNQNLDFLSRTLCPELDYFVAFSSVSCGRGNAGQTNYGFANSSMERVCELRRQSGFHGLAIQWGAIGDVGIVFENMKNNEVVIGNTVPQRMPSCFAVLDQMLQSSQPVCCSLVRAERCSTDGGSLKKKQNLLKTIAHILGIKDYENLPSISSLSELGMDSLMGVEVKQTLERDYEIILSMLELRSLTLKNIEQLTGQKSIDKSVLNEKLKLSIPKIYLPTEPFIKLNNVKQGRPIFLLPPIEGAFNLLDAIAKKIHRPVIGLNWISDLKNITLMKDASQYFVNLIKKISPENSSIDLIGYSFGSVLSFDMALQLQAENNSKVTLTFLDASPIYLSLMIENYLLGTLTANDPDSKFVEGLLTFLIQKVPIDYSKVKKSFLSANSKRHRLEQAAQILIEHGMSQFSVEDIAIAAENFISKAFMILDYKISQKFEGDILLIRAKEMLLHNIQNLADDYGVSQIITGKTSVHILFGNHETFLIDNTDTIASLINEKLDC